MPSEEYEKIKKEIKDAIVSFKVLLPSLAEHLERTIIFDDKKEAMGYFPEPGEEDPELRRISELTIQAAKEKE